MKKYFIIIFILTLIDQAIKIPVSRLLPEPGVCLTLRVNFTLIEDVLFFTPTKNIHGNWLLIKMFDIKTPVNIFVLFIIIFTPITIILYRFLMFLASDWDKCKKLLTISFPIHLSVFSIRLIDGVFWGGTIDYIRLFDWFTFDLADIFINFASVIFIFYSIILIRQYYKLSKEERKEYEKRTRFWGWLKIGLPLKRTN